MDLEDRQIEIIYTPGHTRVSISVIDKTSGMAFCGDTINPGEIWLGLDESLSVTKYQQMLYWLLREIDDNGVTKLHSGHSGRAMKRSILIRLIILCDQIIDGTKTGKRVKKGISKDYKARYKNAAIIWRTRWGRYGEEKENGHNIQFDRHVFGRRGNRGCRLRFGVR